jgi:hypothetical protein
LLFNQQQCFIYSTASFLLCPDSWDIPPFRKYIANVHNKAKKNICVFTVTCQKNLGSVGIFFFFFFPPTKLEIVVPGSGIRFRYLIFENSVKWRIMQFFYLLCSQFRQKASSWINKTLLLVKQQKLLSEFCVKMHRVASKN